MIKLSVNDFSCIDHAEIELGSLTVLIGPQASGKSVISKLVNFCVRILSEQLRVIESGQTIKAFKSKLRADFNVWFPKSAWGDKSFQIFFEAGSYSVKFSRLKKAGNDEVDPTIEFSTYFENNFKLLSEEWDQTREQLKSDIPDKDRSLSRELEAFWQFQNIAESRLEDELGGDYLESQLFIPAGRAFFTSLGKSYALLEQGSALDPVTAQFGRLYSRIRDQRLPYLYNESSRKKIDSSPSENLMTEFFGGTIKLAKNEEYIESSDGRKVPFSALSSGQQELMPLWLATRWLLRNQTTNDLIYVEEPEAHLFPSAQESLTRYLASFVAQPEGNRRLFLTTHSPYVLAGLNNLLKAGELSAKLPEEQLIKLSSVVSMDVWLKPGAVKAYAIRDKVAFSIIDEDGFIDTNYLDEISNDVANTYSSLLDLEYEK